MIKLLVVTIAVALAPARTRAQTVTPDPDPGISGEGFVDYNGHYGEVFKLPGGWKIVPFMRDDAEVIEFFVPFDLDDRDSLDKFDPDPSFFIPKNFSRHRLIRLSIQPARGQSLAKMKTQKVADLKAAGARFKIRDEPFSNSFSGPWPKGSFEIVVDSPYRLSTLYTASPSFFCVLESGREDPPSTIISDYYDWVHSGLNDWVAKQSAGTDREGPARPNWHTPSPEAQTMYILESPGFRLLLMIVFACALLSFIPASWPYLRRISWTARFALFGAAAAFIVGEVMGALLALTPLHGPIHSILFVALVVDAVLAAGAYLLSQRPERRELRSSLLAVFVVCGLYLAANAPSLIGRDSSANGLMLQSGLASSLVGILAGTAFGLFFIPKTKRP